MISLIGPFGSVYTITGSETLNHRFPGQWFQLESGLHYNWHRHYDPTTGRYMQADPLGMPDGPSRYAYVANSPLMYIDPTGESLRLPTWFWPGKPQPLNPGYCEAPGGFGGFNGPLFNENGGKKRNPPFYGEPNSTAEGPGQTRKYGPDGYPETDRDAPHGGGPEIEKGDHAHDWTRPKGGGKPTHEDRGPARPVKPGDPPKPSGY